MTYLYTKSDDTNFSRLRDMMGFPNFKMGGESWSRLFRELFLVRMSGLIAVLNLHTKFEVANFTRYEDMKGDAKCRK